jgi:hypothetical protein
MNMGFAQTAMAIGLASMLATGCSAAPGDTGPSAQASEAVKGCGMDCPDPPPPPPPPVCSWNPLTSGYVQACDSPKPYMDHNVANPYGCVAANNHSVWANSAKYLMQWCSEPIYWEAWNPGPDGTNVWNSTSDQANAYMLLCPTWLEGYVNSLGCSVYSGGACAWNDDPTHSSETFCDSKVHLPVAGWFWAVTWEDPTCNGDSCMCKAAAIP